MPDKRATLMVGPRFDCQGGISAVSKMLYDYLRAEGYPVDHLGSTVEGSIARRNLYTLFSYFRFLWAILSSRYAIIHIHSSTDHSFYRKMVYVFLSRMRRKKVLLHVHPGRFYDFYRSRKRFLRWLIGRTLKKSDALVVLYAGVKDKFTRFMPEERVFVLNNPVVSDLFGCQAEKDEKTVVYLGWIIPEKGVYDIVKAIAGVVEREPSARFLFCGTKEVERLRAMCEEAPFRDHVTVKGWVEADEKTDILSRSAMLLLPSYTEGFPNVILEAMSSCLPIITTPVGAIPEVLREGVNCLYIQPGDVEALEEKIVYLLHNPEIGRRMGEANQKLALEKYDIEKIGEELERIYAQL
jgi:glycosyltransferase involved in cell wall biosynthesis